MSSDIYILGTGLSHNGSAVLLKNGRVCVAIEKERLSRIKHDGGNDSLAIQYCLDAEGILLDDISLVVQCANFEIPEKDYFHGKRVFAEKDLPEIVNISHHLAHAYSAVGTSSFEECNVIVIDGCGSPLHQFLEIHPNQKHLISKDILDSQKLEAKPGLVKVIYLEPVQADKSTDWFIQTEEKMKEILQKEIEKGA